MAMKSFLPIGRDRIVPRLENHPFLSLQRDMERMFETFARGLPGVGSNMLLPDLDMAETDSRIEITCELPGLGEKDVEINVADGVLTIRGEKKDNREEKNGNYRVIERDYGFFSRALELPPGTDASKVEATLERGVLTIRVPKPSSKEAQKIEVKPAA